MDLKQIGSASSLGETAIHIDKIASCNVEIPHLSSYMQEIAKSVGLQYMCYTLKT